MKRKKIAIWSIVFVVATALITAVAVRQNESVELNTANTENSAQFQPTNNANCISDDCFTVDTSEYVAGTLPQEVITALDRALLDEYNARNTYAAVMDVIGSVRPFSMIIRAEERHISLLSTLYDTYGVPMPEAPTNVPAVESTRSANCAVGRQAEILNAELYDNELLPLVVDYPDITQIFTKLRDDSQDKHLPAFERCAS